MTESDRLFLQAALALAEQGRFTCAPNPPVGCVIVQNGTITGRGFHARAGSSHAEVNAVADAGGDVTGATVYVSLEPCCVVGRTPACAGMLIDAGVARVVAATQDPNPKVAGSGFRMLQAAGVEVVNADLPEARTLIQGFASRMLRQRPLVRLKTAASMDGATALASGESQWITGPAARTDVQYWRARSDAIVTGVETVLADDPQLTVRDPAYAGAQQPLRVILDTHLRTPLSARLLNDGGAPTLLVHDKNTDASAFIGRAGVDTWACDSRDLAAVLAELAARGCNEVLVEAGAAVTGSFVGSGLWDEWLWYLAPTCLGSASRRAVQLNVETLAEARGARLVDTLRCGEDLRLRLEPAA